VKSEESRVRVRIVTTGFFEFFPFVTPHVFLFTPDWYGYDS